MENGPETNAGMKEKLLALAKASRWSIIGTIVGGIGGFIYYKMVGCPNGGCMITSNPWITMIWGAVMGYLIGSTFKKNKKIINNEQEHGNDRQDI
jgi:hypothetical protein